MKTRRAIRSRAVDGSDRSGPKRWGGRRSAKRIAVAKNRQSPQFLDRMVNPIAFRLLVLNWAKQSQWLVGLRIIDTDRYLALKQLIQEIGDKLLSPAL